MKDFSIPKKTTAALLLAVPPAFSLLPQLLLMRYIGAVMCLNPINITSMS